jgi:hypothetical protein
LESSWTAPHCAFCLNWLVDTTALSGLARLDHFRGKCWQELGPAHPVSVLTVPQGQLSTIHQGLKGQCLPSQACNLKLGETLAITFLPPLLWPWDSNWPPILNTSGSWQGCHHAKHAIREYLFHPSIRIHPYLPYGLNRSHQWPGPVSPKRWPASRRPGNHRPLNYSN